MRASLPAAEYGTAGVHCDEHPADVHHLERIHQQLATGGLDRRGRGVRIISGRYVVQNVGMSGGPIFGPMPATGKLPIWHIE